MRGRWMANCMLPRSSIRLCSGKGGSVSPPFSPPPYDTNSGSTVCVAADDSPGIILLLQIGRAILEKIKGAVRQWAGCGEVE